MAKTDLIRRVIDNLSPEKKICRTFQVGSLFDRMPDAVIDWRGVFTRVSVRNGMVLKQFETPDKSNEPEANRAFAAFCNDIFFSRRWNKRLVIKTGQENQDANMRAFLLMRELNPLEPLGENGDFRVWFGQNLPRVVAAALTLQHFHEVEGYVHRDFKPQNIFWEKKGSTYLKDWSSATRLGEESLVSEGTPGYVSLEQHRNEPAHVLDDVYAVGASLLWLLHGGATYNNARGPNEFGVSNDHRNLVDVSPFALAYIPQPSLDISQPGTIAQGEEVMAADETLDKALTRIVPLRRLLSSATGDMQVMRRRSNGEELTVATLLDDFLQEVARLVPEQERRLMASAIRRAVPMERRREVFAPIEDTLMQMEQVGSF